ncbi:hypothetical protein [Nesterenkonia sp. NBAIMH1]|uniref:hypothetical protein n=1 Tax=Nesterenkonia sp. NBAIMH1 TaxID=2600320 RepID=UPI0011B7D860|nr:hypothetical protein [Nesterenkonia sp. NBAIMH1]
MMLLASPLMPTAVETLMLVPAVAAAGWALLALILRAKHLSFANKFALGVLSVMLPFSDPC